MADDEQPGKQPTTPQGMTRHVGTARGLLESAAGFAVVSAALYLLGVVREQAFFSRFGIRPLYLDAPTSLYIFRGAPAVATVLVAGYWIFLFRVFGAVIAHVRQRGIRGTLRAFFLPAPGEVRRPVEILSFGAARLAIVLVIFSPSLVVSAATLALGEGPEGTALLLAFVLAIGFTRWSDLRGAVLRHVPEANRATFERVIAVGAVLGLALFAARRTGEQEAWRLVTGESDDVVQARLTLDPDLADALPPGDYFAILITDNDFYLMQPMCPPLERPPVWQVPRFSVASAELTSVQPTPVGPRPEGLPAELTPIGFCWAEDDFPFDFSEFSATPTP